MLNYCDVYHLKLPCRYTDKAACFTKVYIISNTSLEKQYTNVREEQFDVWQAFIRRITKVMLFKKNSVITYDDTDEYFERDRKTDLPVKHMDF
jgi:hypothetical protein